jgi:hypothetical protein
MTKEKVQNKFGTFALVIGLSVLYVVLFLLPLDCLYFILYLFFCHWIACTLFCTFSFAIGLPVLYFVPFLWPEHKVQAIKWPKKRYKIKDRQCTGQRQGTK